jgi:hypothetical protein
MVSQRLPVQTTPSEQFRGHTSKLGNEADASANLYSHFSPLAEGRRCLRGTLDLSLRGGIMIQGADLTIGR